MEEGLGNHNFGVKNGCTANTRCDWNPCSCDLDQCSWCSTCRDTGTTDRDGEKCNGNTKEARDKKAVEDKKFHPDVPAVKRTDLLKESMVPHEQYEVADFLSVPDCEHDNHEKNHGPRKLTEGRVMDSTICIVCNKCLNF